MARRAFLFLLPACLGCSVLCPIGGAQPCDDTGACLPGFACVQGRCVASTGDGGQSAGGCTDSAPCDLGACVAGECSNVPWAWTDAGSVAASLSCYPWPPAPLAGNPDVTLSGCVDVFPVDPESPDAGSVQVFEDGYPLSPVAPLTLQSEACGGLGYSVQAPPGQLLQIAVVGATAWAGDTFQEGIIAPLAPDGGRRDLGAISVNGWSVETGNLQKALGLGPSSTAGLLLGVVRDCAGRPLSGIRVAAGDGGIAVAYLDDEGNPLSRSATGPAGRFAAFGGAGDYTFSFAALPTADAAAEEIASLPVSIAAGGTAFVDVAPAGP